MNKKELVAKIAELTELSQTGAEDALNAVFNTIKKAMSDKDSVAIPGFGSFSSKLRNARQGRNPSTGATIQIPEATVPVFKAASALKEEVNDK